MGISRETRVRRNYLCSCVTALMHLTCGRMETDKLLPAAGIMRSSLEVCLPSPAHCLILPREHQKLLLMCSCSPPILRSNILKSIRSLHQKRKLGAGRRTQNVAIKQFGDIMDGVVHGPQLQRIIITTIIENRQSPSRHSRG